MLSLSGDPVVYTKMFTGHHLYSFSYGTLFLEFILSPGLCHFPVKPEHTRVPAITPRSGHLHFLVRPCRSGTDRTLALALKREQFPGHFFLQEILIFAACRRLMTHFLSIDQ